MKTRATVAREALLQEFISLVAIVAVAAVARQVAHFICNRPAKV